jgi:hypothetical protein
VFGFIFSCNFFYIFKAFNRNNVPGESSETGVLDGVGLCPGGRKCEGDPLFEPPAFCRTKFLLISKKKKYR